MASSSYPDPYPDPSRKWKRKNFDLSKLKDLKVREFAELETDRDMDKEIEQLACDVHEETHNPDRGPLVNIACAQKRMTSMLARVAKSNDVLSRRMLLSDHSHCIYDICNFSVYDLNVSTVKDIHSTSAFHCDFLIWDS